MQDNCYLSLANVTILSYATAKPEKVTNANKQILQTIYRQPIYSNWIVMTVVYR